MQITLNFNTLYDKVSRSLSIIGKRSVDDKGNLLFRDITLGSRERSIINDFFANAITELCGELNKFISAEVQNTSGFSGTVYISFWTDQDAATLVDQVRADGQYLYNYNARTLHQASLSFTFAAITPASGSLFVYGSDYYDENAEQLSTAQIEELTQEQKDAAIQLYAVTDPSTLAVSQPDLYVINNGHVYKSSRNCSFAPATPQSTTVYYAPDNSQYQWLYGSMQRLGGNTSDGFTLTLTMPSNWNGALEPSVSLAISNYCVSYALYSWLTVTAPAISDKYKEDATRQLAALCQLVHEKRAPAESVSPLSANTTVTSNT